jgi:hypothetical protein
LAELRAHLKVDQTVGETASCSAASTVELTVVRKAEWKGCLSEKSRVEPKGSWTAAPTAGRKAWLKVVRTAALRETTKVAPTAGMRDDLKVRRLAAQTDGLWVEQRVGSMVD